MTTIKDEGRLSVYELNRLHAERYRAFIAALEMAKESDVFAKSLRAHTFNAELLNAFLDKIRDEHAAELVPKYPVCINYTTDGSQNPTLIMSKELRRALTDCYGVYNFRLGDLDPKTGQMEFKADFTAIPQH